MINLDISNNSEHSNHTVWLPVTSEQVQGFSETVAEIMDTEEIWLCELMMKELNDHGIETIDDSMIYQLIKVGCTLEELKQMIEYSKKTETFPFNGLLEVISNKCQMSI